MLGNAALPFFLESVLGMGAAEQSLTLGAFYLLSALSLPLWSVVAARLGKPRALAAGAVVYTAGVLLLAALRPTTDALGPLALVVVVAAVGLSAIIVLPLAMLPDLSEFVEDATGVRREGLLYALFGFATKVAGSVGVFGSAIVTSLVGYVPGQSAQDAGTQLGLTVLIGPAAAVVCCSGGAGGALATARAPSSWSGPAGSGVTGRRTGVVDDATRACDRCCAAVDLLDGERTHSWSAPTTAPSDRDALRAATGPVTSRPGADSIASPTTSLPNGERLGGVHRGAAARPSPNAAARADRHREHQVFDPNADALRPAARPCQVLPGATASPGFPARRPPALRVQRGQGLAQRSRAPAGNRLHQVRNARRGSDDSRAPGRRAPPWRSRNEARCGPDSWWCSSSIHCRTGCGPPPPRPPRPRLQASTDVQWL
jgi:hypothetical protein